MNLLDQYTKLSKELEPLLYGKDLPTMTDEQRNLISDMCSVITSIHYGATDELYARYIELAPTLINELKSIHNAL